MNKKTGIGREDRSTEDANVDQLIDFLNSIGVENFARDLSDEKFARRMVELRREFDFIELNKVIAQIREDRAVQDEAQFIGVLYDKSSSYNNVVLTLGYAGFFAIWSKVSTSLSFTANAWVGALLGISLITFIAWTLVNMLVNVRSLKLRNSELQKEFDSRAEQLDALARAHHLVQMRILSVLKYWPVTFGVTVISGFAAGVFLLAILISEMVGFQWSSIIHYVPPS